MINVPEDIEVVKVQRIGRYTIAQVKDNWHKSAEGVSRCSFLDRFDEDRGKDIALGRAIRSIRKKEGHEKIHGAFMG